MASTDPGLHVSPWLLLTALVLVGVVLEPALSPAQTVMTRIEPNGLGTKVSPPSPCVGGTCTTITGGTRSGTSLFQSFEHFSIGPSNIAIFSNTTGFPIKNILSRVTGGASSIFGTIRSFPGANLFLINPKGVIFGPTAKLEVGGSFHVSTADSIRFVDGKVFSLTTTKGEIEVLKLTAEPAAFGFSGPSVAPISIDGSKLALTTNKGQLSVMGGDIQIKGNASLQAPSGRIQVASVASAGEVTLRTPEQAPTSGGRGGTVLIRGGRLIIDNSSLLAKTGMENGDPLGITLQAKEIVLANGTVGTETSGAGRAGRIEVNTGTLTLRGGAQIRSVSSNPIPGRGGQGGEVNVRATDLIDISGRPSAIKTESFGTGRAGDVVVEARRLSVTAGGEISSAERLIGQGGKVTVTATQSVDLSGRSVISSDARAGHGGDIVVKTGRLSVTDGAELLSQGSFIGTITGQAGNVMVTAADRVSLAGDERTGIFSKSDAAGGRAGNISLTVGKPNLNVGTLTLTGGAQIQNGNPLQNGNLVTVTAGNSIIASDKSGISSQAFKLDAGGVVISAPTITLDNGFINTSTLGVGNAGPIVVKTDTLTLTRGGQIQSSSQKVSPGHGGDVIITARDSVAISGKSTTGVASSLFSKDVSSGIFSTTETPGPAGRITVSTPTLAMSDGGKISVATTGRGNAGAIAVTGGTMTLTGRARVDSSTTGAGRGGTVTVAAADSLTISGGSGLFSNAAGRGPGGNIDLRAGQVLLTNGGTISATSAGTGDAGSVAITAAKSFRSQNSVITTEAVQADGGNISLIGGPGSLVHLLKSQITTSVESGKGKGGNITIDPQFVILDNSRIRADAFGGPGGNVRIVADVYLTTDSLVSASSALGVPGTVSIQASITNVGGSLARLPEAVLQAAALLRASCAARLAGGKASSLVLGGRDGLPPEPGGLLPSPLLPAGPVDDRLSRSQGHRWETLPGFSKTVPDPTCSR